MTHDESARDRGGLDPGPALDCGGEMVEQLELEDTVYRDGHIRPVLVHVYVCSKCGWTVSLESDPLGRETVRNHYPPIAPPPRPT